MQNRDTLSNRSRGRSGLSDESMPRRYFPAMYYLASSKLNVALLANLAFVLTLGLHKIALKVRHSSLVLL